MIIMSLYCLLKTHEFTTTEMVPTMRSLLLADLQRPLYAVTSST